MRLLLVVLMLLGACTSYPDACDRRALRELRTVDHLMKETRANLARGYAYETRESAFSTGLVVCSGWQAGVNFCTGGDTRYRQVPVAIDPDVERRKLEALEARQQALIEAASACRPA